MKHIYITILSALLLFVGMSSATAQNYKKDRASGDKYLSKHNYVKARSAYMKALEAKAGDSYIKAKLIQVGRAIDNKFAKVIVKGDKEFSVGNLTAAKITYALALTYKPEDNYAQSQLASCTFSPGSTFRHTYGGGNYDAAQAITKASGGGYLVAGRSTSHGTGNADINVIKLDDGGKLLWDKSYGSKGTEEAFDILETSDGGFVVVGHSDSFGGGSDIKDMWLVKISKDGAKQWTKTFGKNTSIDEAHSVTTSHEDGYIIAGTTLPMNADSIQSDIIIVNVDANGNKKWTKTFGGKSNEQGNYIIKTDDGYTIIGNTETFGKGKWDIWMIHIDKNGNKIWDSTFGGGDNEMGNSVTQTKDGGYMIAGYTYSFAKGSLDAWIVKADASGKEQWAKVFGGLSTDEAFGIYPTKDGNYVAVGYTDVWVTSKVDPTINKSKQDHNILLIKIKESGIVVWERSIGGLKSQRGFDLVETPTGEFILVGYTDENTQKGVDMLVMKVSASGIIK